MKKEVFNMVRAQTAARDYLVKLGIPRHVIPRNFDDDKPPYDPDAPEELEVSAANHRIELLVKHPWSAEAIKDRNKTARFRRTKAEKEQLRQFIEWQKEQRKHERPNNANK